MSRGLFLSSTLVPDLTVFAYVCGMFYLCTTAIWQSAQGLRNFCSTRFFMAAFLIAFLLDIALRRWPIHRLYFSLGPKERR